MPLLSVEGVVPVLHDDENLQCPREAVFDHQCRRNAALKPRGSSNLNASPLSWRGRLRQRDHRSNEVGEVASRPPRSGSVSRPQKMGSTDARTNSPRSRDEASQCLRQKRHPDLQGSELELVQSPLRGVLASGWQLLVAFALFR